MKPGPVTTAATKTQKTKLFAKIVERTEMRVLMMLLRMKKNSVL